MEESKIHDDLASIRNMMERSSRFLSLSGFSGIMAGVYGLIGAGLAYYIIYSPAGGLLQRNTYSQDSLSVNGSTPVSVDPSTVTLLLITAFAVLVASLVTVYVLTSRKAKKQGQALWGKTSKAMLFQMAAPLVTGGLLIIILIARGYWGVVAPACLAFYGLGLIGASTYTYNDIRYLGLCEIALALIAAALPGYGLFFWAMGFGVLHIVYGSLMYSKYDR